MNWIIVGTGAIGGLLAARLADCAVPVQIHPRNPTTDINIATPTGEHYRFAHAQWPPREPCILVAAIKAYQVKDFLAQLPPLPVSSQILLCYNGMLTEEAKLLPANTIHWVTTRGAFRNGRELVATDNGQSWLGWANPALNERPLPSWLKTFEHALPVAEWTTDIKVQRWQKLAINCLINPFTLLHECLNGELLELPLATEMTAIAHEICWLAAQENVHLHATELIEKARAVAANTATNRSSMLSDFYAEKPTEIDYLNGFVAQRCAALDHPAVTNFKIWQQVRDALNNSRHPR